MEGFYEQLCQILNQKQVMCGERMSRHTTFRTGGPAAYFVEPATAGELAAVLELCRRQQMPYCILGNGSNLLVSDQGYDGVVVEMGKAWSQVTVTENCLTAGAGTKLVSVAREALKASLTGLEFTAGIPGTVGGAVVMNAGAYGSEIKQVLRQVTVLTAAGTVQQLDASELELGYRTSCILQRGYVVLAAAFELQPGDSAAILARMEELSEQRRSKQPLEYPSAGSTFKRPEGYFAGKLIEDAGLRGFRVGGAQVSEKHCGFVVNYDHATAADIMDLCQEVQRKVREQSGISLELEVKTLGMC